MSVLPNDYDSDPDRFLATEKHPHDDVHPYVAARFAAAGARTVLDVGGGNGKLARLRSLRSATRTCWQVSWSWPANSSTCS